MVIDRTKELKSKSLPTASSQRQQQQQVSWESLVAANKETDIELGIMSSSQQQQKQQQQLQPKKTVATVSSNPNVDQEEWMQEFFEHVEKMEGGLAKLQAKLPLIDRLHGKILTSFQEQEEKKLHAQLDDITGECSALAYALNSRIQSMEQAIDQDLTPGSADYRMCFSQHVALSRKLRSAVSQFQQIQKGYREKQKTRFRRQYKIINPEADEEEIARVLDEQHSGPIFADSILSAHKYDEARNVLNDVTDRHKEIVNLSKSIVELELLFSQLSTLVEHQDEIVNQVAYLTENAQNYLLESTQELGNAIKSARKARARRWCLLVMCLILMATVTVIVVIVVKNTVGN